MLSDENGAWLARLHHRPLTPRTVPCYARFCNAVSRYETHRACKGIAAAFGALALCIRTNCRWHGRHGYPESAETPQSGRDRGSGTASFGGVRRGKSHGRFRIAAVSGAYVSAGLSPTRGRAQCLRLSSRRDSRGVRLIEYCSYRNRCGGGRISSSYDRFNGRYCTQCGQQFHGKQATDSSGPSKRRETEARRHPPSGRR